MWDNRHGAQPDLSVTNAIFPMTNEELIQKFESDAVPEDCFHHADHVRLRLGMNAGSLWSTA